MRERRAQQETAAVRNVAGEGAGASAAGSGSSQGWGRPDGCFSHALGGADGTATFVELCPGRGGYLGLAGEAFGLTTLVLRDPATGDPLTAEDGGIDETVVIDPRMLAERAAAALDLPTPAIHMSPQQDQVVNLASWLWISDDQWQPRQASASAGPVTSTVTAAPAGVTWDMGNGDEVDCDGPGTPYRAQYVGRPDASDCTYTYRHSSAGQPDEAYQVTATINWNLTWTATGAPGGGDLGTVPMTATQPVRVTEIQALVQPH